MVSFTTRVDSLPKAKGTEALVFHDRVRCLKSHEAIDLIDCKQMDYKKHVNISERIQNLKEMRRSFVGFETYLQITTTTVARNISTEQFIVDKSRFEVGQSQKYRLPLCSSDSLKISYRIENTIGCYSSLC